MILDLSSFLCGTAVSLSVWLGGLLLTCRSYHVWIISIFDLIPICKMNDDCVLLLEKVLAENSCLRETIEARDAEHRRVLQEINAKLDTSDPATAQAKSGRKTARKVQISQECRVSDKYFLLLSYLTLLLPKNYIYTYRVTSSPRARANNQHGSPFLVLRLQSTCSSNEENASKSVKIPSA